jgi:hypothetical protein
VRGKYIYVIPERLKKEWEMGVIMHEIGHLMGVEHMEGTLMSAYFNKVPMICLDYGVMKAVGEKWGIGIERLNYCKRK